jgi:hypothetical protein
VTAKSYNAEHYAHLAKLALVVVEKYGGKITFDEYDKAMFEVQYFAPFEWINGWGLGRELKKANDDKMCAFVACDLGYIRQTQTGYELC